jgi:hypothetical protein
MTELYREMTANLSIQVRAGLWIAIIGFIIWPVFFPLIKRALASISWIFRGVNKCVHFVICICILERLHKAFGGVYGSLDGSANHIFGVIDNALINTIRFLMGMQKRHMRRVTIGTLVLFLIIAIPNWLPLKEDSPFRVMNKAFLHIEVTVFKMESNSMAAVGLDNQSPTEPGNSGADRKTKGIANNYRDSINGAKPLQEAIATIANVSLTIRRVKNYLNVHTEPNTTSETVAILYNGDLVEYLNQQSDDWVMIGCSDGIVGWVRSYYVEGLPE